LAFDALELHLPTLDFLYNLLSGLVEVQLPLADLTNHSNFSNGSSFLGEGEGFIDAVETAEYRTELALGHFLLLNI